MKYSTSWLHEWVNPEKLSLEAVCEMLTMSGLEVEEVSFDNATKDQVIDLSITPNRGDCLSIKGLAREIAAITNCSLNNKEKEISEVPPKTQDTLPVSLESESACPRYVGRVIRNVKPDVSTPSWMQERLQKSGIRSINPVVDVTNYVMLELGQPMHAFDLKTIEKKIVIRQSKSGETISLLDGTQQTLDGNTLVIADQSKPVAIAGVMGGLDSSVTLLTTDIFLESAYFSPEVVARQRQYYNLNSDSAYRFERGVDPFNQRLAIERATQLILSIAGGDPGPVIEKQSEVHLPTLRKITLFYDKIKRLLGVDISADDISQIFTRLGFTFTMQKDKWDVTVPPYRFDISIPEDLIEEIARLYGYNNIPTRHLTAALTLPVSEEKHDLNRIRSMFRDLSYHEVISYSFIDPTLQQLLDPNVKPTELANPITANMTVMRTNLWPGLVNALLYNKSRQQQRIRLFEIGTCFTIKQNVLYQEPKLAGLVMGSLSPEQWGIPSREVDFFDVKGDLENVAKLTFQVDTHPVLHPGQTAALYHGEQKIGIVGALHPSVLQALDLPAKQRVFVFELSLDLLPTAHLSQAKEISKFPEVRRDIAIMIKQTIPAKVIQDTIRSIAGDWLKDVFIFDVYQGKGISPGLKSMALGLIWQHPSRTLVDDEITQCMERVIVELKGQLGAELRS